MESILASLIAIKENYSLIECCFDEAHGYLIENYHDEFLKECIMKLKDSTNSELLNFTIMETLKRISAWKKAGKSMKILVPLTCFLLHCAIKVHKRNVGRLPRKLDPTHDWSQLLSILSSHLATEQLYDIVIVICLKIVPNFPAESYYMQSYARLISALTNSGMDHDCVFHFKVYSKIFSGQPALQDLKKAINLRMNLEKTVTEFIRNPMLDTLVRSFEFDSERRKEEIRIFTSQNRDLQRLFRYLTEDVQRCLVLHEYDSAKLYVIFGECFMDKSKLMATAEDPLRNVLLRWFISCIEVFTVNIISDMEGDWYTTMLKLYICRCIDMMNVKEELSLMHWHRIADIARDLRDPMLIAKQKSPEVLAYVLPIVEKHFKEVTVDVGKDIEILKGFYGFSQQCIAKAQCSLIDDYNEKRSVKERRSLKPKIAQAISELRRMASDTMRTEGFQTAINLFMVRLGLIFFFYFEQPDYLNMNDCPLEDAFSDYLTSLYVIPRFRINFRAEILQLTDVDELQSTVDWNMTALSHLHERNAFDIFNPLLLLEFGAAVDLSHIIEMLKNPKLSYFRLVPYDPKLQQYLRKLEETTLFQRRDCFYETKKRADAETETDDDDSDEDDYTVDPTLSDNWNYLSKRTEKRKIMTDKQIENEWKIELKSAPKQTKKERQAAKKKGSKEVDKENISSSRSHPQGEPERVEMADTSHLDDVNDSDEAIPVTSRNADVSTSNRFEALNSDTSTTQETTKQTALSTVLEKIQKEFKSVDPINASCYDAWLTCLQCLGGESAQWSEIELETLTHACDCNVLLMKKKISVRWNRVRCCEISNQRMELCKHADIGCSFPRCTFPHSEFEKKIWEETVSGRIDLKKIILKLRSKVKPSIQEYARKHGVKKVKPKRIRSTSRSATETGADNAGSSGSRSEASNVPAMALPYPERFEFRMGCLACFPALGGCRHDVKPHEGGEKCPSPYWLLGRDKRSAEVSWCRIRERKSEGFSGNHVLCRYASDKVISCTKGENCSFPHNYIELKLWDDDKDGSKQFTVLGLMDRLLQRAQTAVEKVNGIKNCWASSKEDAQFYFVCGSCLVDRDEVRVVKPRGTPCKDHPTSTMLVLLKNEKGEENPRLIKIRKRTAGETNVDNCPNTNTNNSTCSLGDMCPRAHSIVEFDIWTLEMECEKQGLTDYSREMFLDNTPECFESGQASSSKTKSKENDAAKPTEPVAVKPPKQFPYRLEAVCSICLRASPPEKAGEDPKTKKCKGSTKHPWIKPAFISDRDGKEVRSPLLFRSQYKACNDPLKCRKGRDCTFPHTEVEKEIWYWMYKNDMRRLEDVMEQCILPNAANKEQERVNLFQKQPEAPAPQMAETCLPMLGQKKSFFGDQQRGYSFYCNTCNLVLMDSRQYRDHCESRNHHELCNKDSGHRWNHRAPPTGRSFELCKPHFENKRCQYSHVPNELLRCLYAHSQGELDEWNERIMYRRRKGKLARDPFMTQFTEKLSDPDTKITDDREEVEMNIDESLERISAEKNTSIEWKITVTTEEPVTLRGVVLYDGSHPYLFSVLNDFDDDQEAGAIYLVWDDDNPTTRKFVLKFRSQIFGSFYQRLALDFGDNVIMERIFKVNQTSSTSQIEEMRQIKSTLQIPNEWIGYEIVPFEKSESTKTLPKEHEVPNVVADYVLEDENELTTGNYVDRMRNLLHLEELQQQKLIASFNLQEAELELQETLQSYDSGLHVAVQNQLFGRISLDRHLGENANPAAYLLMTSVSAVFIKPSSNESTRAFECRVADELTYGMECKGNDYIWIVVSSQAVKELNWKKDTKPVIDCQFQLDRDHFQQMHNALDKAPRTHDGEIRVMPRADAVILKPLSSLDSNYLNDDQKKILTQITASFKGTSVPPLLVCGSFGTGKTETLGQAVLQLLKSSTSNRILVCTHNNSAADLYITRILHELICQWTTKPRIFRWYFSKRKITAIKEWHIIRDYTKLTPNGQGFAALTKGEVKDYQLIITTLRTAYELLEADLPKDTFTHILIDEAAQVIEPEVIIPLSLAGPDTRIVFAGDPIQMQPVVFSERAGRAKLKKSILERLWMLYKTKIDQVGHCIFQDFQVILTQNYRSEPELVRFISTAFYDGPSVLSSTLIDSVPPPLHSLSLEVVAGEEKLIDQNDTSYYNEHEASAVAEVVAKIITHWPENRWGPKNPRDICVISCSIRQVIFIRKLLRSKDMGKVVVETMRTVQGQEFRSIILSCVRTRHGTSPNGDTDEQANFDFFSDRNLINTAFTRAKSTVTVVADPVALLDLGNCGNIWRMFMDFCEDKQSIFPPGTTVDSIRKERDDWKVGKKRFKRSSSIDRFPSFKQPTQMAPETPAPMQSQSLPLPTQSFQSNVGFRLGAGWNVMPYPIQRPAMQPMSNTLPAYHGYRPQPLLYNYTNPQVLPTHGQIGHFSAPPTNHNQIGHFGAPPTNHNQIGHFGAPSTNHNQIGHFGAPLTNHNQIGHFGAPSTNHIQKRVPRPLAVIDPRSKQPVSLNQPPQNVYSYTGGLFIQNPGFPVTSTTVPTRPSILTTANTAGPSNIWRPGIQSEPINQIPVMTLPSQFRNNPTAATDSQAIDTVKNFNQAFNDSLGALSHNSTLVNANQPNNIQNESKVNNLPTDSSEIRTSASSRQAGAEGVEKKEKKKNTNAVPGIKCVAVRDISKTQKQDQPNPEIGIKSATLPTEGSDQTGVKAMNGSQTKTVTVEGRSRDSEKIRSKSPLAKGKVMETEVGVGDSETQSIKTKQMMSKPESLKENTDLVLKASEKKPEVKDIKKTHLSKDTSKLKEERKLIEQHVQTLKIKMNEIDALEQPDRKIENKDLTSTKSGVKNVALKTVVPTTSGDVPKDNASRPAILNKAGPSREVTELSSNPQRTVARKLPSAAQKVPQTQSSTKPEDKPPDLTSQNRKGAEMKEVRPFNVEGELRIDIGAKETDVSKPSPSSSFYSCCSSPAVEKCRIETVEMDSSVWSPALASALSFLDRIVDRIGRQPEENGQKLCLLAASPGPCDCCLVSCKSSNSSNWAWSEEPPCNHTWLEGRHAAMANSNQPLDFLLAVVCAPSSLHSGVHVQLTGNRDSSICSPPSIPAVPGDAVLIHRQSGHVTGMVKPTATFAMAGGPPVLCKIDIKRPNVFIPVDRRLPPLHNVVLDRFHLLTCQRDGTGRALLWKEKKMAFQFLDHSHLHDKWCLVRYLGPGSGSSRALGLLVEVVEERPMLGLWDAESDDVENEITLLSIPAQRTGIGLLTSCKEATSLAVDWRANEGKLDVFLLNPIENIEGELNDVLNKVSSLERLQASLQLNELSARQCICLQWTYEDEKLQMQKITASVGVTLKGTEKGLESSLSRIVLRSLENTKGTAALMDVLEISESQLGFRPNLEHPVCGVVALRLLINTNLNTWMSGSDLETLVPVQRCQFISDDVAKLVRISALSVARSHPSLKKFLLGICHFPFDECECSAKHELSPVDSVAANTTLIGERIAENILQAVERKEWRKVGIYTLDWVTFPLVCHQTARINCLQWNRREVVPMRRAAEYSVSVTHPLNRITDLLTAAIVAQMSKEDVNTNACEKEVLERYCLKDDVREIQTQWEKEKMKVRSLDGALDIDVVFCGRAAPNYDLHFVVCGTKADIFTPIRAVIPYSTYRRHLQVSDCEERCRTGSYRVVLNSHRFTRTQFYEANDGATINDDDYYSEGIFSKNDLFDHLMPHENEGLLRLALMEFQEQEPSKIDETLSQDGLRWLLKKCREHLNEDAVAKRINEGRDWVLEPGMLFMADLVATDEGTVVINRLKIGHDVCIDFTDSESILDLSIRSASVSGYLDDFASPRMQFTDESQCTSPLSVENRRLNESFDDDVLPQEPDEIRFVEEVGINDFGNHKRYRIDQYTEEEALPQPTGVKDAETGLLAKCEPTAIPETEPVDITQQEHDRFSESAEDMLPHRNVGIDEQDHQQIEMSVDQVTRRRAVEKLQQVLDSCHFYEDDEEVTIDVTSTKFEFSDDNSCMEISDVHLMDIYNQAIPSSLGRTVVEDFFLRQKMTAARISSWMKVGEGLGVALVSFNEADQLPLASVINVYAADDDTIRMRFRFRDPPKKISATKVSVKLYPSPKHHGSMIRSLAWLKQNLSELSIEVFGRNTVCGTVDDDISVLLNQRSFALFRDIPSYIPRLSIVEKLLSMTPDGERLLLCILDSGINAVIKDRLREDGIPVMEINPKSDRDDAVSLSLSLEVLDGSSSACLKDSISDAMNRKLTLLRKSRVLLCPALLVADPLLLDLKITGAILFDRQWEEDFRELAPILTLPQLRHLIVFT